MGALVFGFRAQDSLKLVDLLYPKCYVLLCTGSENIQKHVCIDTPMYTYMDTYIHMYTHVYIYKHMYIYCIVYAHPSLSLSRPSFHLQDSIQFM